MLKGKGGNKMSYKIFKGYFENIDYSNPDIFLNNNEQTILNVESINEIGKIINDRKDISTLKDIYNYIKKNFNDGQAKKFERGSLEIFESKILSGCNDYGLVFAAILRYKGIPTVFVQSAYVNWIKELNNKDDSARMVRGHIFLEVYIGNKWYLLDSTLGILYDDYNSNDFSYPNGYYGFSKSLTGWEAGCINMEKNNNIMKRIFIGFDLNKYIEPNYKKIQL
jgi:hypothetical protein